MSLVWKLIDSIFYTADAINVQLIRPLQDDESSSSDYIKLNTIATLKSVFKE